MWIRAGWDAGDGYLPSCVSFDLCSWKSELTKGFCAHSFHRRAVLYLLILFGGPLLNFKLIVLPQQEEVALSSSY